MVRIGPAGAARLTAVQTEKAKYDERLGELDARYKVEKALLKAPVVEAVESALHEGVPARQVALKGLGFADVASMKQFRRDALAPNPGVATSAEVQRVSVPTINPKGAYPIVIGPYDFELGQIHVTDSTEAEYVINFFGDNEGPTEGFWEDFSASPDADEIRERLAEKYPRIHGWNE